ncbi:MAG: DUF4058 family protein [Planctomycetes bacterium]|nr:DUF4058 family protein [Planctomycetota bacterium]
MPRKRPGGPAREWAGTAIAEPLVLYLETEPVTETYLEIIEVGSGRRVVTVIEILFPSNKAPGAGREAYVKKQREVLAARSNLVEIDLLRGGDPVLPVPRHLIPPSHRTPYLVSVRRGARPDLVWIYRAPLAERLPAILVPLRETDDDVPLDLQAVLDRAYESGAYDDLDYRAALDPPLDGADATWADSVLSGAGRRRASDP